MLPCTHLTQVNPLGELRIGFYALLVRLLCISDIHGHADALAAVLATAERHGYNKILVAGDLCFPGPAPLDTFRRLMQANAICVQGSGDRALATLDVDRVHASGRNLSPHERARLDRLSQVRSELGDVILERLARLPATFRLPLEDGSEIVLVHGSPADPLEPITHDMTDEEIGALLGDDPADIVLCGGSHVAFERFVSGVRVIGLGSVGEAPGAPSQPHADLTILDARTSGVVVERLVVPLGKAA